MKKRLYVFGDNRVGQLGISYEYDNTSQPNNHSNEENHNFNEIKHIDCDLVSTIQCNQYQTFVVMNNGVLYTCGSNDNSELCRIGKRSLLQRVDAIETFQIKVLSLGSETFQLLCNDGKVLSWGKNDLGQLCTSNRIHKEKPRLNTSIQDVMLQISSGGSHTIAMTRSGRIITWGGNSKGQLGDGQLTSSTIPISPIQLRHRPIVGICCGESHCLVLSIGGNVYAWGDNSYGQLGLMDTTNRLRPQQINSLRSIKVNKISAGRNHSLVISHSGLLLSFGSNCHGQLGLDLDLKIQSQPQVVERLREFYTINAVGGFAHTLVLTIANRINEVGYNEKCSKVYVMGLNSSGQLGLKDTSNHFTPTHLCVASTPVAIFTGPLSMHSLIMVADRTSLATTTELLQQQQQLPSLDYTNIAKHIERYKILVNNSINNTNNNHNATESSYLFSLRKMIYDAFSSIPVLNASFLLDPSLLGHGTLCIDLHSVRASYDLLLSTEHTDPSIMITLGRATLHLAEQLKECPFDDAENLSVFLIVLENPLMLRCNNYHVVIELVIRGILAIPKYYRVILFKWLKSYPSEYFARVLRVLQDFLSYILTNKSLNLDPTPSVIVLETLYQCNVEVGILPENQFYNDTITKNIDLQLEWINFRNQGTSSCVFNYFSYPFLIRDSYKLKLLQHEFLNQQIIQQSHCQHIYQIPNYVNTYIQYKQQLLKDYESNGTIVGVHLTNGTIADHELNNVIDCLITNELKNTYKLPYGLKISFEMPTNTLTSSSSSSTSSSSTSSSSSSSSTSSSSTSQQALTSLDRIGLVTRENLLDDLLHCLDQTITDDINTLKLPLRVVFLNEIGRDYGGVKRELFTIALKQIFQISQVFSYCNASQSVIWFLNSASLHSQSFTNNKNTTTTNNNDNNNNNTTNTTNSATSTTDNNTSSTTRATTATTEKWNQYKYPIEFYLGLIVGLATYHGVHVDLPLPSFIFKILRKQEVSLIDLYAVDNELAVGLQKLLEFQEGSIEESFGVTFSASSNPLVDNNNNDSDHKVVEHIDLIENGNSIVVNRSNRKHFVDCFIQHALHTCVSISIQQFLKGLQCLCYGSVVDLCSVVEFENILCGSKDIDDLSHLRMYTVYKGIYNDESLIINWFWDILSSFSILNKRKFLHFVTGTSTVPLGGLSAIKLVIQSISSASTMTLPTAHTCFNTLNIPDNYKSCEHLQERLMIALQYHQGFGLV